MATSGQTLNDRINAARFALAGQGLARCVCKATTEEVLGPKKKHLDYLLACTHEPNVSIPQLANLLIERSNHVFWVVVFKALVTVHQLMSYGNERFIQYLASSNYSFELSTFLDKTATRDFSMSTFIRRYSRYINEKALSYRLLAFDFCKVKRGEEGVLRIMPIDRLLKTLPILQNQLDALLEFDCTANDLNNGVINSCFMLLFRDLIGLFACHNDGIINLLNKYFTLNKKMCREAFDLYKKFLVRMDKVSDFLRVAEAVGIDKDEIPELRRAPNSLIDALEQHLQNIDTNKKILKQQSASNKQKGELTIGGLTPPSSRRSQSPNNTTSRPSTSNISTSGSQSTGDDFGVSGFKDDEVRKAIEEEALMLSQYNTGTDGSKSKSTGASKKSTSEASPKFAVTTIPKSFDDIFGDADTFATASNGTNASKPDTNGNSTSLAFSDEISKDKQLHGDALRSTIRSATNQLEFGTTKKPSDDLLGLLEANFAGGASQQPPQGAGSGNLISPFAGGSPFDMPPDNKQSINSSGTSSMKANNPFPDTSSAFVLPSTVPSTRPPVTTVFRTGPTTANYTNLGGLEGFGEVLQPRSSSADGKAGSMNSKSNAKQAFGAGAGGLPSTGLFKGDLDSTLANLAQNLTLESVNKAKK